MFSIASPASPAAAVATPRTPRYRRSVSASAAMVSAPVQTANMYDLLSVSHTAGTDEIRSAYRRLALLWHPDACRSAGEERRYAERFMEAREAYEVLSDPVRRRNYDLSLSGDRWAAAVGAAPAFREGRARRQDAGVTAFGNWDLQLDGLRRRSAVAETGEEETWGSRLRRARAARNAEQFV
ncbi:chaperone protein dnaJ 20, chloroplastic-like [Zingiber officinale]|nr:chaperone protein dnaJ 20, chloroplastic-like [Zingiber officinale]